MKKIYLRGTNIGTLGSFELPINRLTVLTAGTGMGKSLLSRAAAFMANAGALLDEAVTCHIISSHFELVEEVIHRIDEADISDDHRNALLDELESDGLHEDNIRRFREKGFVTEEELKTYTAMLNEDYTEYERGETGVLSAVKEETVNDAVLANFPGIFHDGYEEKGEHSLVMQRMLGGRKNEDELIIRFDGEGELREARLPFTRNAVYLSETPLCAAPYPDDDSFPYDYESVRDRMYFSLVNHAENGDAEKDPEEAEFRRRLDMATDKLLSETIEGTVDYDPEEMEFTYTRDDDGAKFYLEDMSRGIELIADLALMVKKRQIHPDSLVILDSIDSALDSEWREALAVWISRVLRIGPRVFVTTRSDFADCIAEELYGIREKDVTWLMGEGSSQGSYFYDEVKENREREEFLEHMLDEGDGIM